MVDYEDIDTREERRQYTRDNDVAIIRESDGDLKVIDNSGNISSEFSSGGKRRVRTSVGSGGSSGSSRSRPVTDQTEALIQDAVIEDRVDEKEVKRAELAYERALRDGNISLIGGGIGRVNVTFEDSNMSPLREEESPFVSSVRAATEDERRAMRRDQSPFFGFVRGVGEGLILDESLQGLQNEGVPDAREYGQVLGLVGGVALLRPAAQGVNAARSVVVRGSAYVDDLWRATRAGRALDATRAGRATVGLAKGAGQTALIIEGGRGVANVGLSSEQRELLRDDQVRAAIRQGREAEAASVREGGFPVVGFGREININPRAAGFELVGTALSGRRGTDAFAEGVESALSGTPLSSRQQDLAVRAALREKRGSDFGELASLLNIARFSEGFGRREIGLLLDDGIELGSRSAVRTGLIAAPSIATAGFIEGFSQEVGQQIVRERDFNLNQAVTMGGFGAVAAGGIGGVIAGGGVARSGTTRAIELGTWVADPFEKPGDLLQDVFERNIAREFAPRVRDDPLFLGDGLIRDINPRIRDIDFLPRTPVFSANAFGGTTLSNTLVRGGASPVPVGVPTPANIADPVGIFGVGVPNPVPSPNPVPIPTDINIPAGVLVDSNLFVPSNVNVPVPAPTPAPTPTPIPIVVPENAFFPFPPPNVGGSLFGAPRATTGRRRKGRASTSLFQSLVDIPEEFIRAQNGNIESTGIFLRGF